MAKHKVLINWREGVSNDINTTTFYVDFVKFEGGFVLLLSEGGRVEAYPAQDIKSVYINE